MLTTEFAAFGTADHVRAKVQAYIGAGATKFVMRPCGPFEGWREQVQMLAREVIAPLQTPDRS
jgi:alkanesulfonate monooxygenase SsuD/methylene tetrahydromethanopterin reductase-like flavin-dependent oxidoreductase (luciferase family)